MNDPSSRMSGLRKAAVLLVSVGPQCAATVLNRLNDEEIEELSLEMAGLGWVDSRVENDVRDELVATVEAYDSLMVGGVDYAREVLERSLGPERAAELSGRLMTVIEKRPFQFLRNASPDRIVTMLASESPQTIAVVVAYLHRTLAGQVLSSLPDELGAEVGLRIAQMRSTSPEVVARVEKQLRRQYSTAPPRDQAIMGGTKSVASLLARGGRSLERTVLDGLAETEPELAREVRQLLFTFDDIADLDDRAVQLILREADQKDLVLALRGVTEDRRERFLSNLSSRASELIVEELAFQPPQPRRTVEEAQQRLVAIARRLEDAGTIIVSRGDDDAVI